MNGYRALPGGDLVNEGVADLREGRESIPALLVSIGAPRLRALGLEVPPPLHEPEHRLYERLRDLHADAAHSRHNALIRRLVAFERAMACALYRHPSIDPGAFRDAVEATIARAEGTSS